MGWKDGFCSCLFILCGHHLILGSTELDGKDMKRLVAFELYFFPAVYSFFSCLLKMFLFINFYHVMSVSVSIC